MIHVKDFSECICLCKIIIKNKYGDIAFSGNAWNLPKSLIDAEVTKVGAVKDALVLYI